MKSTTRLLGRYLRSFSPSVGRLAGGTAAGQVVSVAALILIGRLFTPADFGVYGLFSTALLTALLVTSLQLEVAIPSASSDDEAADLLIVSVALVPIVSAASVGAVASLGRFDVLGFGELPGSAVLLLGPTLVVGGLATALRYQLLRSRDFDQLARVPIAQHGTRAGAQVGAGFLGAGALGLAAGEFVGWSAAAVVTTRRAWPLRSADSRGLAAPWGVVRSHWRLPLIVAPAAVLNRVAVLLPVPLFAGNYGLAVAGSFALVQRAVAVPSTLLGQAVTDSFHAEVAKLDRDSGKPAALLRSTSRSLLIIGAAASIATVVVAPWGLPLVLGDDWKLAGRMAAVVAPWAAAALVVSPISSVIYVYGGAGRKLAMDSAAVGLTLFIFLAGDLRQWGALLVLALLSGLHVVRYLIYYWLLTRLVQPSRL